MQKLTRPSFLLFSAEVEPCFHTFSMGNGYKLLAQRFLTIRAFSIVNNRLTLDVISQS